MQEHVPLTLKALLDLRPRSGCTALRWWCLLLWQELVPSEWEEKCTERLLLETGPWLRNYNFL
jgi:hypothetical protein